MKFTQETLWKLRNEIVLCSLYYGDYENSFGYDSHGVCDFFDGYAENLGELMNEDGKDGDNKFFDYLDEYDNSENLWEYYFGFEDADNLFVEA